MIHSQGRIQQSGKRTGETGVCDLVPRSAALRFGHDDAAVAKAGQVVRNVGRTEIQIAGQCRRIDRAVKQGHENA